MFTGFMTDEGKRLSLGRLIMNAMEYIGNFENDMPNGRGIIKLSDGQMYCGEFINGQIEGMGFYLFKDSSYY